MTGDWNWLLETRSRKLLSESDRRKMSRYNFHTNWMSNCQSLSDLSSCMINPETGSYTTRETWQQQRRRREREGCVSSVYSRGRTSTDEPEKHLIYDLGLVLFGDRELKGDCDRGGSLSPWRENRECGQCLIGTGCESRGPGWGQVGTISIYWDIGSFPREWRPLTSVTQCDV